MFLNAEPPELDEVRKIFADIVRDNRRASQIPGPTGPVSPKRGSPLNLWTSTGWWGDPSRWSRPMPGRAGLRWKADPVRGFPDPGGSRAPATGVAGSPAQRAGRRVRSPQGRRVVRLETQFRVTTTCAWRWRIPVRNFRRPSRHNFAPVCLHQARRHGDGTGHCTDPGCGAHQGTHLGQNNAEGGATFQFTLPTTGGSPA